MKSGTKILLAFQIALVLLSNTTSAQQVSARLSGREAWVDSPLALEIQINNANQYELADEIVIDGCEVELAGTPSQSTQITIINGRRSESRSIVARYWITPKRPGKFEIPEIEIQVDGKRHKIRGQSFVATESETGDLMFVEIQGKQDKVFVGEPLDLKLKIWIKPYRDRANSIELNEGSMWQMVSDETSWGPFNDRISEIIENRQRPEGKRVLRGNEEGAEREYFLYEIDSVIYPTKPGKINASDLKVVVNYPLQLGRSRDPFDRFFDDDFFGGSMFRRRLSVTKARPVSAEANVDSTEVLPIPMEGRPDDYRGAVGKYQIVARAEPTSVAAGDPITLQLGIVGDGPMELVQAPPLHELDSLTAGFKITDQSLAGFVQGDSKVFVTSIRPRNNLVSQIPAIPFSFFDPEKSSYETVYSKPIAVNVTEAETLQLDAIVSNQSTSEDPKDVGNRVTNQRLAEFQNDFSTNVLANTSYDSNGVFWQMIIWPPLIWLSALIASSVSPLWRRVVRLKSLKSQALEDIGNASTHQELIEIWLKFVGRKTKSKVVSIQQAIGQVRLRGYYEEASKLENFLLGLENKLGGTQQPTRLVDSEDIETGKALLELIHVALEQSSKELIRSSRSSSTKSRSLKSALLLGLVLFSPLALNANDVEQRRETVLVEANEAYQRAQQNNDIPDAKELFGLAATKYQWLVDQGIQNDRLFLNLANSQWQSGALGKAIANCHRALIVNPDSTAKSYLDRFRAQLSAKRSKDRLAPENISRNPVTSFFAWILDQAGKRNMMFFFIVCWVAFWGIALAKTLAVRKPILRWITLPLVGVLISGFSLWQLVPSKKFAVILSDRVELRENDGREFSVTATLDSAMGIEAEIFAERPEWIEVQLPSGSKGWLPEDQVEVVSRR